MLQLARTSNRENNSIDNTFINSGKAAIYTRLSHERTEEWREKSNSIENQIEICREYLKKENLSLNKIYTDYEYSGTNFDRPAYSEMMDDVRNGSVNCIIIRDLSRLGREHIELGKLIDKVFPFLGVRFISVVDNIDTKYGIDSKLSFEMTIKNLINDMYAKDISEKVKTSLYTKAKSGFFIGSNPPYGYKVIEADGGRKLIPDEKSSPIIKKIFSMYADGINTYKIAQYLNKEGIATSSSYFKTGNILREPGEPQWRKGTISKMLRNKVYTGDLVQAKKTTKEGKKSGHYFIKPEDSWIIFKNAHEAIISHEIFNKVQDILDNNLNKEYFKNNDKDYKETLNRYKGLIFDGNTNLSLSRTVVKGSKKGENSYYHVFTNNYNNGEIMETPYIRIYESELDELVIEKLKGTLCNGFNEINSVNKLTEFHDAKKTAIEKSRNSLIFKIRKLDSDLKTVYENYSLGIVDKSTFLEKRAYTRKLNSDYRYELDKLDDEIISVNKEKDMSVKLLKSISKKNKKKLPEDLIKDFVEKIEFYDSNTFNITLKGFSDKGEEYCG